MLSDTRSNGVMERDAELLRSLRALGWEPAPHGDRTYHMIEEDGGEKLDIYVRLHENWVIASVVPFLSTRGRNSFELCRWLLRQTRDMHQAKFAIDDDGDISLSVEVPTESLDPSELRAALHDLVTEAIRHRQTLRGASIKPGDR